MKARIWAAVTVSTLLLVLTSILSTTSDSLALSYQQSKFPGRSMRTSINTVVSIGSREVTPGEIVTVPLGVSSMSNLGAATIEVRYDPSVIKAIACNPDPDGTFDSALCNPDFDNDGGATDASRFSGISTNGISGDALLAEISLQVVGQMGDIGYLGVTAIDFGDPHANPIEVSVQDGGIIVGECYVDSEKIQAVAGLWHQEINWLYDCDADGKITVLDITCWAKRLGETCPTG